MRKKIVLAESHRDQILQATVKLNFILRSMGDHGKVPWSDLLCGGGLGGVKHELGRPLKRLIQSQR